MTTQSKSEVTWLEEKLRKRAIAQMERYGLFKADVSRRTGHNPRYFREVINGDRRGSIEFWAIVLEELDLKELIVP